MSNLLKPSLFLRCAVQCDCHGALIQNKKLKNADYRKASVVTRERDSTASVWPRSLDLIQPSGWKGEARWSSHMGSFELGMTSGSKLRSLPSEASSMAGRTIN